MRKLWQIVASVLVWTASTGVFAHDVIQTHFVRSCMKSMTAAPQGLPADLSASICLCTIGRIVRDPASRRALKTVEATHDYSVFHADVKKCVHQELPKYMQAHPEFLKNYVLSHPDVLNSTSNP